MLFVLRKAPYYLSDQLGVFDGILRLVLSHIVNIDLTLQSIWLQATQYRSYPAVHLASSYPISILPCSPFGFKLPNIDLTLQSTWLQATLPVRTGGIGIRRAVQLAPSAYLASAAGCSDLIHQLLPSYLLTTPNPNIETALSI